MAYADAIASALKELKIPEKDKAREDAHTAEFVEKVLPVLVEHDLDPRRHMLHFEDVAEGVAHVVLRKPKSAEFQQFRHKMWRDSKETGTTEKKSKAGPELAAQCLLYPSPAEYKKLCDENAGAADAAAKLVVKLAEGGAAELEKD